MFPQNMSEVKGKKRGGRGTETKCDHGSQFKTVSTRHQISLVVKVIATLYDRSDQSVQMGVTECPFPFITKRALPIKTIQ